MRKCPNCGTENKPSAKFCVQCGAQLPAEVQTPTAVTPPAVPPAAGAPGKKKFWGKAAILALVLVVGVLLFKGIGLLRSCPTCDEILELQKELQTVLAENEDNSLTFDAYDRWNMKVATLSSEIQLLNDHECKMPVRKVKNQAYSYGRYMGNYTGEWKSTAPYGEGVFSGSYMDGSTQHVCTYSGEWSVGVPNGVGSMMQHREYLGGGSQENWSSKFFEGTFVDGSLTGDGWSSAEYSSGDRVEYFDGVYRDGFLQGQANFLQYRDGQLYDKGVVEGMHYETIYSERQEILNALNTAGGLLVAGVASYYLFDLFDEAIDLAINGEDSESFQNSDAARWLESQRAALAADVEQQQREKEKEETRRQLYNDWQALEGRVKWCETSPYDYVRDDTDYFRAQAKKAKDAYNAF